MDKGTKIILCIIATMLISIAERGVPIKFKKWDMLWYAFTFAVFLMIAEVF